MFKITALLCVLAVNGENLCMFGDLPTSQRYNTPQECFSFLRNNSSNHYWCTKYKVKVKLNV